LGSPHQWTPLFSSAGTIGKSDDMANDWLSPVKYRK